MRESKSLVVLTGAKRERGTRIASAPGGDTSGAVVSENERLLREENAALKAELVANRAARMFPSASTVIIAACIEENAVLKELKCATRLCMCNGVNSL